MACKAIWLLSPSFSSHRKQGSEKTKPAFRPKARGQQSWDEGPGLSDGVLMPGTAWRDRTESGVKRFTVTLPTSSSCLSGATLPED